VNDGVHFRMHGAAQFISFSGWNVFLLAEAASYVDAILHMPWGANIPGAYDLVVVDDHRSIQSAQTGASLGNRLGNSQVVFGLARPVAVHGQTPSHPMLARRMLHIITFSYRLRGKTGLH